MIYIVETFIAHGEKSRSPIRVRPVAGQGLSPTMRVECSKSMRTAYPIGQKFCINAKITQRLGSPDFLYSSYRDEWNPVTDEEAQKFIKDIYSKK
jgi:hypothetical protein